jgi:homoserine O-acetyltransferase/O-succinyltransferase
VSHPDATEGVVAICSTAREYPFGGVRLEGAKGAIMGDPTWDQGRYTKPPVGGLQALGLHWAAWAYSPEWWRRGGYQTGLGLTFEERVEKWKKSFLDNDANDLLAQAVKWQKHNVGETPGFGGDLPKALRSIKARVLLAVNGPGMGVIGVVWTRPDRAACRVGHPGVIGQKDVTHSHVSNIILCELRKDVLCKA